MTTFTPRWSRYGLGYVDTAFAVALSVLVVISVSGSMNAKDPRGGVAAGLAAIALTVPVAWARRAPLPAAAVVAAGSVFSWLAIGSFVRCGPSLPAAFWIAYVVGRRTQERASLVGIALVLLDIEAQCMSDPNLGAGVIVGMGPIALGFWFAGRTLRARASAIREIDLQNTAIADTRERTTALAVAADRERISAGLDGVLQERIAGIAAHAAEARRTGDPDLTAAAFAAIASDGRQTLTDMRDVVGVLRSDASLEPQPGLDRLTALITRHGGRLELHGERRQVPGGIEVSAYRIVEQLLQLLDTEPGQVAYVAVRFSADELELQVSGRRPRAAGNRSGLAQVRQRVAVHDGSFSADESDEAQRWTARLPLPVGRG